MDFGWLSISAFRNHLQFHPRRRQAMFQKCLDVGARSVFEPLKVKQLRGDVQEREVSHFYWQTMNNLGNSHMPGPFICTIRCQIRNEMSSVFRCWVNWGWRRLYPAIW